MNDLDLFRGRFKVTSTVALTIGGKFGLFRDDLALN